MIREWWWWGGLPLVVNTHHWMGQLHLKMMSFLKINKYFGPGKFCVLFKLSSMMSLNSMITFKIQRNDQQALKHLTHKRMVAL